MKNKSKQRDAVLRVLRQTTSHPSAVWIYEQVKKDIPSVALGTVYRNLRLLKEAGEILEIQSPDRICLFDGNTVVHYHFRCDRCGHVIDVDEPYDTAIDARISVRTGLKVTHHQLELGGVCLDCQKRESAGTDRA
jgi:Fur family peroxide stress response transcriptional regulator